MKEFEGFEEVDNKFLQFGKDSLSSGYADKKNHPSLKSCLLRVPGSVNSKCVSEGISEEESKVKIIQKWDGKRVPISHQIGTFHSYLISEREKEKKMRANYVNLLDPSEPKEVQWIEKLLKTPIEDHRKFSLWRILVPYLVNVNAT